MGFVRFIASFFRFHNKEEETSLHPAISVVLWRQRKLSALKDACCPLAWVHLYNPGQPNHIGVFVFSHLSSHAYDVVWHIQTLQFRARASLGPFCCLLQKDNIKFINLIIFFLHKVVPPGNMKFWPNSMNTLLPEDIKMPQDK